MNVRRARDSERGAALIVVLLLVATLSFIALAISETMALAASRSTNIRLRSELFWQGVGAEALARRAIVTAMSEASGKLASDNPLVAAPIDIPFVGGSARVTIADRTRCFNLNSLVERSENASAAVNEAAVEELEMLAAAVNRGSFNARSLAAVAVDWIDADSFQEPQGAEDGYYTARPTPYRTGGALIADVSELRAMAGVDRAQYSLLRSIACAHPTAAPSVLNINLLTSADAPLLGAILGDERSLADIQDLINARPPGGYGTLDAIWASEPFAGVDASPETKARLGVYSRYLEVNAQMEYYGANADLSLMFEVDPDGRSWLISRRFGRDE